MQIGQRRSRKLLVGCLAAILGACGPTKTSVRCSSRSPEGTRQVSVLLYHEAGSISTWRVNVRESTANREYSADEIASLTQNVVEDSEAPLGLCFCETAWSEESTEIVVKNCLGLVTLLEYNFRTRTLRSSDMLSPALTRAIRTAYGSHTTFPNGELAWIRGGEVDNLYRNLHPMGPWVKR
jgi:hypothetical protein